jgi:hypothetical protein
MSCGAPTIYKGEFMLADRRYCYPLTITDLPAATSSRARALHHQRSLRVPRIRGRFQAIRIAQGHAHR